MPVDTTNIRHRTRTYDKDLQFPIQSGYVMREIPWGILTERDQVRAKSNHSQSLERLAKRGGLSPGELVHLFRDEDLDFTHPRDRDENELEAIRLVLNRVRVLEGKEALNAR